MQYPTLRNYSRCTQSQTGAVLLKQLKILVVESDPDSSTLCQLLLAESYATVLTAKCVSQALIIATCAYPDVVISDLRLPEEDGYVLIQKIHQLKPICSIGSEELAPCFAIALDTSLTPESRERAFLAGYQAYLTKPFELNELLLRVEIAANRMFCHLPSELSIV
jgi:two-component system, OmpR family, response regulator